MKAFEAGRSTGTFISLSNPFKAIRDCWKRVSIAATAPSGAIARPLKIVHAIRAPIVNSPEVAILGVSRSTMQPVWDGEKFVPRLMLPLSFSYDHRVIDGAMAVRFTTFLGESLADVDKLLQAIP